MKRYDKKYEIFKTAYFVACLQEILKPTNNKPFEEALDQLRNKYYEECLKGGL